MTWIMCHAKMKECVHSFNEDCKITDEQTHEHGGDVTSTGVVLYILLLCI